MNNGHLRCGGTYVGVAQPVWITFEQEKMQDPRALNQRSVGTGDPSIQVGIQNDSSNLFVRSPSGCNRIGDRGFHDHSSKL